MIVSRTTVTYLGCIALAVATATAPAADAVETAVPTPGRTSGTIAFPPGGPIQVYPQDQTIGGANPLIPFGTDPLVPYGVWTP